MITTADIRRQDAAAIASLTKHQRAALGRMSLVTRLGLIGQHSGKTVDERTQIVAEDAARRANPLDVLFTGGGVTVERHHLDEPRPVSAAEAEELFKPRIIDIDAG